MPDSAATPARARVRTAGPDDVPAILPLIERHFGTRIARAEWRRLFDYAWAEKPNLGWVLDQGGRLVGFLGAVYAERPIDGRAERFCNLTTMCVDVEHRAMAPFLMMAARLPGVTVTDLSPRPSVQRLLERAGFTPLDTGRLIVPPLLNASFARTALTTDRARVRAAVDEPLRRLLDDHLPYGCLPVLVEDGDRRCLVLAKRRVLRRVLPLSEILFASDPDLLSERIDPVTRMLAARQRTLAACGDRRLFGARPPRGIVLGSAAMVRSPRLPPERIDNLYSELVLLPM